MSFTGSSYGQNIDFVAPVVVDAKDTSDTLPPQGESLGAIVYDAADKSFKGVSLNDSGTDSTWVTFSSEGVYEKARAYVGTGYTVATAGDDFEFDTTSYTVGSITVDATNHVIKVSKAGKYLIHSRMGLGATQTDVLRVLVDGVEKARGTDGRFPSATTVLDLEANDEISIDIATGTPYVNAGSVESYLEVARLR